MRALIACEESQAVTIEMRKLGIEAYSCDTQECSGGHPEWHIRGDVIPLLAEHWDMILAFPPCTHLCVSGAAWFEEKRKDGRQQQGIDFFMEFINCKCERVAIENPVGIMSRIYRKPDQIIHPYYFGDMQQKKTCLWLKNIPPLLHEDMPNLFGWPITNVKKAMMKLPKKDREKTHYLPPSEERAKLRSKTFPGIALAMATQWGKYVMRELGEIE